jgi:hypothetical protein
MKGFGCLCLCLMCIAVGGYAATGNADERIATQGCCYEKPALVFILF